MLRTVLAALILGTASVVSGCSFQPVYGDHDPRSQMSLAFDFAAPNSRTEQIIYEELSFRFSQTKGPNTPRMTVTASTSAASQLLTKTPGLGDKFTPAEVTVTATATVTYESMVIFKETRFATAQYTGTSAILADATAVRDAEDRAAKSVAESLRLVIMAKFPTSALEPWQLQR